MIWRPMHPAYELFAPHVTETFTVSSGDQSVEMTLAEAKRGKFRNVPQGIRSEPFSLYFKCSGTLLPTQGMYTASNPATGDVEIFIVPIGREKDGVIYEAIFN